MFNATVVMISSFYILFSLAKIHTFFHHSHRLSKKPNRREKLRFWEYHPLSYRAVTYSLRNGFPWIASCLAMTQSNATRSGSQARSGCKTPPPFGHPLSEGEAQSDSGLANKTKAPPETEGRPCLVLLSGLLYLRYVILYETIQRHRARAVVVRLGEGGSGRCVVHRERAVQLVVRAAHNLDGGDVDVVARQWQAQHVLAFDGYGLRLRSLIAIAVCFCHLICN